MFRQVDKEKYPPGQTRSEEEALISDNFRLLCERTASHTYILYTRSKHNDLSK
jgi:hypothetical protein